MNEQASRNQEVASIFSRAHAARLQGLHEWDAGYYEGLDDHLARSEKLKDMRQDVRQSTAL